MRADELLTANLGLIERAIAFACRRYQLSPEDAEEFASVVKLRLVENDYAILRAHEGRSSLATYMSIVVQRMALDYRIHVWGKWHDSAEAKRLGELAVSLERLLHRDGRSLDDAYTILAPRHAVTREELQSLADRLPPRLPRTRDVALEEAESVAVSGRNGVEANVLAGERQRTAERLSTLMNEAIARLPEDDQIIIQLRFQDSMTVAQIARSLQLDQKLLYRRIEKCMRDIRRDLESSGLDAAEVLDLIGRDETILDFRLRKRSPRPSMQSDGTAAHHPEDWS